MLHIPSAVVYFLLSSVMVFGNKYLINQWNFNYPIFLILTQILITLSGLLIFNLKFQFFNTNDLFSRVKSFRYQLLTALFFSLHSITALKSLVGLNIPMYATFKRCTPLVNLLLSLVMFKKNEKSKSFLLDDANISIFVMTFGVILASIGDLKFDLNSYFYCGASVIFQSLYLSFIQKCSEKEKKESVETLYFSNLFALPFLILFFFITNEWAECADYFLTSSNNISNISSSNNESMKLGSNASFMFSIVFISVLLCGCFLCFSQIWCTTNNNAVTTSVIGVLKSFLQTLVGMFFYGAYEEMSYLSYIGILLNLIFGTWYTYLKYMEKETKNNHQINEKI